MRIVCIHAHPDDAEILVGGTLALLASAGHQITIVSMTAGDCGTRDYPPDEIARIRRNEARQAAHVIGAEYLCGEFRDMAIFNDDASRRRVTQLLRQARADVVLTASPVDYHCDHEATSVLVRDACFAASAPNYAQGPEQALPEIPHLYFVDPVEGRDRDGNVIPPDFIADVSAAMDTKTRMLECHESQRKWLRQQHHMDNYIEFMREWTAERGKLAGFTFGEGFRAYRCHPYPVSPVLEDALRKVTAVSSARA